MKLPLSWVKDYVDIDITPEDYASGMTMSGSLVEGIENLGEDIQNVVVGKILKIEKHPDADKLIICQVDLGDETVQIVTGASNVNEGDYIPVAKHGARLPGGIKIKKSKLRGVKSNGMLCSIGELQLTKNDCPYADEDGILILDKEHPLGKDIKEVLGLNEDVIEFEITSNRPDCLSILGLARESAITFNKQFKYPAITVKESDGNINDYVSIEVLNSKLCPRYAARVVKNIKIEPSPQWLRDRLRACGVRPINNIVDITNYVMLEFGQPMHAFDLNNLKGHKVIVRQAENEEIIRTLDDEERKLDNNMLAIADEKEPIAVAGVMGGASSEVTENTETILFESANFLGTSVRLTAKKLGMRTESSARFEKGLDVNNVRKALDRACQLINELGAGEVVSGVIDINNSDVKPLQLKLRPERINAFLGIDVSKEYMIDVLERLEFEIDKENMLIKIPSFRADVIGEADVAEEIARIYGYDKIQSAMLKGETTQGGKNKKQIMEDIIRNNLISQGLYEIITYTFTDPIVFDKINIPKDSKLRKTVNISNPLGKENSIMRTITMPQMLEVMARNYSHKAEAVRLFEIGKVFIPKDDIGSLPQENSVITIGMYGGADFYDIKGCVEELFEKVGIKNYDILPENNNPSFHPGRTAKVYINDKEIGILGEVHPQVLDNYEISERSYIAMLDFNVILMNSEFTPKYKSLPKYPAVQRDIAVLVEDNIMVMEIENIIKQCSGKLLEQIKLFDVYKGKQVPDNMKSVAYSILFRAADRTLTDEKINKTMNKIIETLKNNLNAQLR